jgi:hypothetical protein
MKVTERCQSITQKGTRCKLRKWCGFNHCQVHCTKAANIIYVWWYRVYLVDKIAEYHRKLSEASKYAYHWLNITRKRNTLEEECQICLENFMKRDIVADNYVKTPCGHTFHTLCLFNWWEGNTTSNCPTCRKDYTESNNLGGEMLIALQPIDFGMYKDFNVIEGEARMLCNSFDTNSADIKTRLFAVKQGGTQKIWITFPYPLWKMKWGEPKKYLPTYCFENVGSDFYLHVQPSVDMYEIPLFLRNEMKRARYPVMNGLNYRILKIATEPKEMSTTMHQRSLLNRIEEVIRNSSITISNVVERMISHDDDSD